jgi:ABC-type multidrug transport system fused ATPase/permease subunit
MDDAFGTFQETFLILLLLNFFITLMRAISYIASATLSMRVMFTKLNKQIIFSYMKFYDQNPPGRIITRISKDVETIDDYLSWVI